VAKIAENTGFGGCSVATNTRRIRLPVVSRRLGPVRSQSFIQEDNDVMVKYERTYHLF